MRISKIIILIILMSSILMPITVSFAKEGVRFSCQMPYFLGRARTGLEPGERVQALFSIENSSLQDENIPVTITLPSGIVPMGNYENWQIDQVNGKYRLQRQVKLSRGYSQWFDLLMVQAEESLLPGTYRVTVRAGDDLQEIPLVFSAIGRIKTEQPIMIEKVILPLEKEGKRDERLDANTLVLRDRSLDYYKNILRGKGTSNLELEAVHPLTHMGLEIRNPSGQQKLVVITACLVDANTQQPVLGLFTPGTTGEDKDAGSLDGHEGYLVAFVALDGDVNQQIQLPVYVDERLVTGGKYILQISMKDEISSPIVKEIPLTVVKKDWKAMIVVGGALLILAAAMLMAVSRMQQILLIFKTRWLVTIALFGAVAFAVVNVPSTIANDFLHILMGPFAFLITGLFNSIFLYMLIISLVILIPRPGVVALMAMVRMLLGMLAFGHISPVSMLSYGMNALMLETLLYLSGMYQLFATKERKDHSSLRNLILLALLCGAADSVSTYVSIQAMSFLYRMYYADWYLCMLIVVNSCLYTGIGASCGVVLGNRLARVGGD